MKGASDQNLFLLLVRRSPRWVLEVFAVESFLIPRERSCVMVKGFSKEGVWMFHVISGLGSSFRTAEPPTPRPDWFNGVPVRLRPPSSLSLMVQRFGLGKLRSVPGAMSRNSYASGALSVQVWWFVDTIDGRPAVSTVFLARYTTQRLRQRRHFPAPSHFPFSEGISDALPVIVL